jgi:hypothetical protein
MRTVEITSQDQKTEGISGGGYAVADINRLGSIKKGNPLQKLMTGRRCRGETATF